jgi:hypothetical protein
MEDSDGNSKLYYVIFKPIGVKRWWAKFLYKPFGHVFIATKTEMGHFWIVSDCKGGNIFTELVPTQDLRELFPRMVIIPFQSITHKEPHFRFFHINCVEIVKLVLGIRSWRIITPYQLYKHIEESHHGHDGRKERQKNRTVNEEAESR